ncbi:unnamed protein product [Fraxinus pennsylvanica]|uniref:Uncharacterized protein n=1 Tax=Fraxinus pennsylvanica TaxID=56036 RepID=A0AAD2DLV0_9LAMI|nr:unnamed protein product [Fraxinus pennsylvanica]
MLVVSSDMSADGVFCGSIVGTSEAGFGMITGLEQGISDADFGKTIYERKKKKNIDIEFDIVDGNDFAGPELDSVLLEKEKELQKENKRKALFFWYMYRSAIWLSRINLDFRINIYSPSIRQLDKAWILYKDGRSLELIHHYLGDSANPFEVLRLIHMGVLCVRQCPDDRPSMATVVAMLDNEIALPLPNQQGFFRRKRCICS